MQLKSALAVATLLVALSTALPSSAWASEAARSVRGQDVVVIEGEDRTVYEYSVNGVIRMIRIVPENGRPYYLVPTDPMDPRGYGNLEQANTLPPQWILMEF